MSMLKSANRNRVLLLILGISLVGVLYALRPQTNADMRSQVRAILISPASQQEVLKQLEPYIKIGDSHQQVTERLSPVPSKEGRIKRPTEWSLGVGDGVQLVIAMKANGRVVGIGRWRKGIEKNGEEWLTGPNW